MTQRVKVLVAELDDSLVPQVLHSGRKKTDSEELSLTSGCTLWYAPPPKINLLKHLHLPSVIEGLGTAL